MIDPDLLKYQKENDNYLKNTFSGWIKQNFLIRVKNTLLSNPFYFENIFKKYDAFNLSIDRLVHKKNDLQFEICQFIVMFHLHNTFNLDEGQIGKLQNDDNYIGKLCSQVYDAIVTKEYASYHLSSYSFFGYYPLAYYCGVSTNYLSNFFNKKISTNSDIKKYDEKIFLPTFGKILTKATAICVLINANLFEETFGFLRYIIESFAIFMALNGCDKAIKYHNRLTSYREIYASTGKYPKQFLEDCKRFKIDDKDMAGFANYGWLYYVPTFKKNRRLSFNSVLNSIPDSSQPVKTFKKFLRQQYKVCGTFVHSTTVKHNSYQIMNIVLRNTAYFLDVISEFFKEAYCDIEFVVDGVNVQEKLREMYMETNYSLDQIESSRVANKLNSIFLKPYII